MKIITLLSDFGSFYPAQMKGVILSQLQGKAKEVTFVDIGRGTPCRRPEPGQHRTRGPAQGPLLWGSEED